MADREICNSGFENDIGREFLVDWRKFFFIFCYKL